MFAGHGLAAAMAIGFRRARGAAAAAIRRWNMAKGQQKKTKETRKPKKEAPAKPNASNPSLKGTPSAKDGR
jgi:hypothetical protein